LTVTEPEVLLSAGWKKSAGLAISELAADFPLSGFGASAAAETTIPTSIMPAAKK
jgi:hypothetical protein